MEKPAPEREYKWVSVNAILYKKLQAVIDNPQTAGLPHRTDSDVVNSVILEYLLTVAPDPELLTIKQMVDEKQTAIHKTVKLLLKNDQHKHSSSQDS